MEKNRDEKWYAAQAPIPMYTRPANLQVLFMRNDEVNVYVMDYWPCSAKHPMPKNEQLFGEKKQIIKEIYFMQIIQILHENWNCSALIWTEIY